MASSSLSPPGPNHSASPPKPPRAAPKSQIGSHKAKKQKDDGFGYEPTPNNPANQQTLVRDAVEGSAAGRQKVPFDLTASVRKENLDRVFTETKEHIFQRKSGGWYARLPDVDVPQDGQTQANVGTGKDEGHGSLPPRPTHLSTETAKKECSTELELCLQWENPKIAPNHHGLKFFQVTPLDLSLKKVLSRRESRSQRSVGESSSTLGPRESDFEAETVPRVFWRHDVHDNLSILKLLHMVEEHKSVQLSEGEFGLTKRLLTTLEKVSERMYVGGRYLVPLSLRYDNQDVSKYTIDKTCIFFCFPYVSLAPETCRKYYERGESKHPPRTLLQSHYRLNKTEDRDSLQCISWLEQDQVGRCIFQHKPVLSNQSDTGLTPSQTGILMEDLPRNRSEPSEESKRKLGFVNRKSTKQLFFVPQFWGLIVGLDTLITLGVTEEKSLRGVDIEVDPWHPGKLRIALSLVRILFYHGSQPEELIFPVNQCDSCYGLLNKKQQIVEFLKTGDEQLSKANLDEYKFFKDNEDILITMDDWGHLLYEAYNKEMVTIRMLKQGPEISIQAPAAAVLVPSPENLKTDAAAGGAPKYEMHTPAFLQWKMQDEFGEEDKTSDEIRVAKFLRAIYLKLPVPSRMTPREKRNRPQSLSEGRVETEIQVSIRSKKYKDLEKLGCNAETAKLAEELSTRSKILLSMYIPKEIGVEGDSEVIRIFWGAIMELVSKAADDADFREQLRQFIDCIDKLTEMACRIHQGVRCLRPEISAGAATPRTRNGVADGVILLASIVNSLGSIFQIFIEAARFVGSPYDDRKEGMMFKDSKKFKVVHYWGDALTYLRKAESQLISEADGTGDDLKNKIGPVLTPEAISIGLMERLISGAHQSGTIDVVLVYEYCLEDLSLKVKHEASRRLLQRISEFLEEVKIMIDVLTQQDTVLRQFKENLNPETFQATSVARKLRYKYECRDIDRLLLNIKEKMNSFSELQQRAHQLSTENMRLVETRQDDNSKAIFIFTMVTVLFLPLSFVAGFFGMNLKGINGSERDYWHFWKISLPMTAGIILFCGIVSWKGEDIEFLAGRLWRKFRKSKRQSLD